MKITFDLTKAESRKLVKLLSKNIKTVSDDIFYKKIVDTIASSYKITNYKLCNGEIVRTSMKQISSNYFVDTWEKRL